MLSLNKIINRVRSISLSHGQVKNFYFGITTDFLTDKTTTYPSVFASDNGGTINQSGREVTLSVKLFFLDLVNVAGNAKENELDVQSDMLSVAVDVCALMNASTYTDWAVTGTNSYQIVREEFDDMVAGVSVDLVIRTPWDQSYCEVP
jgi:hypothetical protein